MVNLLFFMTYLKVLSRNPISAGSGRVHGTEGGKKGWSWALFHYCDNLTGFKCHNSTKLLDMWYETIIYNCL